MSAPAADGVGRLVRVSGPVAVARGLPGARLHGVVRVGAAGLLAEVVRIAASDVIVQIYEETSGLRIGDEVRDEGGPLQVELGPGLLGSVYDGIQRPLRELAAVAEGRATRPWIARGDRGAALDRARRWSFSPSVRAGDELGAGDLLGTVREGPLVHRVLVPPGRAGVVERLRSGDVTVTEPLVWLDGEPVGLSHRWPVRRPRPSAERLDATEPLVTGQRVIDALLPLARGGSATIPGGFGTGKTVTEQSLARWSDADVVVYVACGERGNELSELLRELPELSDPRTGGKLIDRTVLIANTSNMPVAAREASIHTGLTIAEYYRDQGYDVAVLADSTSRWAEALREVSGRLEELPAEEGYPAYLPSRLAEVYERAGRVVALGRERRIGSVSLIAAVSPPGGDFSEPVTQYSLRLAGTFWALDADLARARHFPAVDVTRSYSLYELDDWFHAQVASDWSELRTWALDLLGRERELRATVQLLGLEMLGPAERLVLATGRRLCEDFLQQSAFDPVDAFCPLAKQRWMLWAIRAVHEAAAGALTRGVELDVLERAPAVAELGRMRGWPPEEAEARARGLVARHEAELP